MSTSFYFLRLHLGWFLNDWRRKAKEKKKGNGCTGTEGEPREIGSVRLLNASRGRWDFFNRSMTSTCCEWTVMMCNFENDVKHTLVCKILRTFARSFERNSCFTVGRVKVQRYLFGRWISETESYWLIWIVNVVNVFSAEEEFLGQDPSVATVRREGWKRKRERERERESESMRECE